MKMYKNKKIKFLFFELLCLKAYFKEKLNETSSPYLPSIQRNHNFKRCKFNLNYKGNTATSKYRCKCMK